MLCEATCGLSVELEGPTDAPTVKSVRGDRQDPFSRGYICPKAAAIPDIMSDPDRLREPQRRIGKSDRWESLTWDDALDEAARRIATVQKQYGPSAVGIYLGNPTVHSQGAMMAMPFFLKSLDTRSRFSATSADQLPHMLASLNMFGHQLLQPIPDVDRTEYMLILGANPAASNGSLMTAPGIGNRLKAIGVRGGRVVVIDPRRSETAELADKHHFIRPGGDAALLLGMMHVIFRDQLGKIGRLEAFTDGIEELRAIVARFSPERVAKRAGIGPATITRLAQEFAGASSAICYGRVGACTQDFGGLAAWLVNCLNVVTGNLDREGGVMFTQPAADLVALAAMTGDIGHFGRWKSRVRGLPEFSEELPTATLAEEIDTPGDGQIRALITFAGNPVLSSPNGARLEKALAGLDTMVSIDLYRNETTRHADLIMPTPFGFERDHYDLVYYMLAVRNVARWAPALMPPPVGVKRDFDLLIDLALRIRKAGGGTRKIMPGLMLRLLKMIGSRRALDWALRFGPHRLSLAKLEASPEGIDLGPLQPMLPRRLYTKGKRIRLVPQMYVDDLLRLEGSLDGEEAGLVLIGRRQLRSNNSWMHNSQRLVKGPTACTLLMHPKDAAARGLSHGDRVRAETRVGAIEAPLAVSDEIAEGVVSLPHGWGHGRAGSNMNIAAAHRGVSINDLTDEQRIDILSGNASFSGVPTTVVKAPTPGA